MLILKALLKGSEPNKTIAPLGLIILFSCSHIKSKSITESHLQAVVPYGGSVIIASTLPLSIFFITSKQSPLYNSIIANPFTTKIQKKSFLLVCDSFVTNGKVLFCRFTPD